MKGLTFRKIPIAATPIRIADLFYEKKISLKDFQRALEEYSKVRYCLLVNSGTAAFFLILKTLSRIYDKREIILPAYTAAALVLPIQRLGLKVQLCEISLDTFNIDTDFLKKVVSKNTLGIVAVHLFGIPCQMQAIVDIAKKSDAFVIEDAAQAQGATIDGRMAGTLGDIGFFSFNRGKNLPTYSGGCIVTNLQELADIIAEEIKFLQKPDIFFRFFSCIKLAALSLTTKPILYGLFYPFISLFKSNAVPRDFFLSKYTDFQAGAGLALLARFEEFSEKRYRNGISLINALKAVKGIILPEIPLGSRPIFNRLPVVFRDLNKRKEAAKKLWEAGIETSRLYLRPLHHIFDLGYKKEDFPNANYFAQRMLTLPVHPLIRQKDIDKIISVFRKALA